MKILGNRTPTGGCGENGDGRVVAPFMRGRWIACGLASAVFLLLADAASAQTLPLKRSLTAGTDPGTCAAPPPLTASTISDAAAIDSLVAAGSRAAILGDHVAARGLLEQASALDPDNLLVSYRLARTLEEGGEYQAAVVEYCRYLALAPEAPDTAEIQARVRDLAASGGGGAGERWEEAVDEGAASYDADRFAEAVTAFTRAIEIRPRVPDAYYNRAVAHLAMGSSDDAISDLDAYLEMYPDADDATRVRTELEQLRSSLAFAEPAPEQVPADSQPVPAELEEVPVDLTGTGSALVQGLVLPGLGQHATGRTGWGVVVLGAVAGAVYYGYRQEEVVRLIEATDPFGNTYQYESRFMERPNQAVGFAAAGVIALAGAVEASLFARRQGRLANRAVARAPATLPGGSTLRLVVGQIPAGVSVGVRFTPARPGDSSRKDARNRSDLP